MVMFSLKICSQKNTYTRNVDKRQDAEAVSGEEADGWTSIQFEKKIVKSPCQNGNHDCQDTDLSKGPVNLCVALARTDMAEDASWYAYHSWRSSGDCEKIDFLKDANKEETKKEETTEEETTKEEMTKEETTVEVDKCLNLTDNYDQCPRWSSFGYCDSYKAFMQRNCKKSCNGC